MSSSKNRQRAVSYCLFRFPPLAHSFRSGGLLRTSVPGTLLGGVGDGSGWVVSKLPREPVLVEFPVSRRSQAMSKTVAKGATRHTCKSRDKTQASVVEQNRDCLPSIKRSREVTPGRRCYICSVATEPSFHDLQKK